MKQKYVDEKGRQVKIINFANTIHLAPPYGLLGKYSFCHIVGDEVEYSDEMEMLPEEEERKYHNSKFEKILCINTHEKDNFIWFAEHKPEKLIKILQKYLKSFESAKVRHEGFGNETT